MLQSLLHQTIDKAQKIHVSQEIKKMQFMNMAAAIGGYDSVF